MSAIYVFIATKTTAPSVVPPYSRTQSELNRRISQAVTANAAGVLTVGDLKLRPVGNAIPNHLLCDGSAVSRSQFPELFALLGVSEGAGDGVSTFNLPDYGGDALTASNDASQVVSPQGTVKDTRQVMEPVGPGSIGGTSDGNVVSGGAPAKIGE